MSEEKSSTTNGLGTDPMKRLTSFKPPRDLTLGGVKANKKVFTPNLNVTRNKNKGPITKQNNQKKDDKDKKDKKNERNRHLKNGPNIIKSSGVFSEGLGSVERHTSRGSYYRESDSVQSMQRPTIRVKDVVKIDKELEEQKIKTVMGDTDNMGESDSEEDFRTTKAHDAPVQLPMGGVGWSQVKPTVKVKPEIYIKTEPGESDGETVDKKPPIPDVYETYEQMDVVNILTSEEPKLILLQLPPLPGRGGKSECERPRRRVIDDDEPSTSSETTETEPEKPVDTSCNLADLDEGRIGKLRIHRSGRVSMAMGNTLFDVSLGTHASFLQEVMSMAKDDESRSANLITLGALQHKLLITPNWEDLFQRMNLNK